MYNLQSHIRSVKVKKGQKSAFSVWAWNSVIKLNFSSSFQIYNDTKSSKVGKSHRVKNQLLQFELCKVSLDLKSKGIEVSGKE